MFTLDCVKDVNRSLFISVRSVYDFGFVVIYQDMFRNEKRQEQGSTHEYLFRM